LNIKSVAREPLVHFLLIGLLLFLVYGRVAPESADSRTIEVSKARIEGLSKQFESVWNRPPSSEELRGIIDSYVRDEVLYREGMALGLDGDDPVIKRRVRQKLEVISEEAGNQVAATDAELSAYLSKNADKFQQRPILSFEQVFFSGDAPVSQVEQQSRDALAALNKGTPATDVGQPTMLPARVEAMPADLVARDFGDEFAKKLESLPLNVWQGPIASGFGAHLVRVTTRKPAELPPLADIRPLVLREWENARRERNRAEVLKSMMKNYTVVIDSETATSEATP
jgi:PPIC-type PPIASE domain